MATEFKDDIYVNGRRPIYTINGEGPRANGNVPLTLTDVRVRIDLNDAEHRMYLTGFYDFREENPDTEITFPFPSTVNIDKAIYVDGNTGALSTVSLNATGNITADTLTINSSATIKSPSLTGTPTAPTAAANTNNTQIATTAFVRTAISNLVNSAPAALDTLSELATALGNDSNFATTVSTNIGKKLDSDSANYIKSLSLSGKTLTITKGNNTTSTLTTQDTTYDAMSLSEANAGTANTNRTITAKVLNDYVAGKCVKLSGDSTINGTLTVTSLIINGVQLSIE